MNWFTTIGGLTAGLIQVCSLAISYGSSYTHRRFAHSYDLRVYTFAKGSSTCRFMTIYNFLVKCTASVGFLTGFSVIIFPVHWYWEQGVLTSIPSISWTKTSEKIWRSFEHRNTMMTVISLTDIIAEDGEYWMHKECLDFENVPTVRYCS